MDISNLLTLSEKTTILELMSPSNTLRHACVARLYYGQGGQWKLQASGVITLEKRRDSGNALVCFYDLLRRSLVSTTYLFLEMQYRVHTDRFHTFAGDNEPVGLAFADSREAVAYSSSFKYELAQSSGEDHRNNKPVGQGKARFAGFAKKAIEKVQGKVGKVLNRNEYDNSNVNVEFRGFEHNQHVGLDSNGEMLRIQAKDKEVASQLLKVLGLKVDSEEDMDIVCNVIRSHGSNEIQQALDARREHQDSCTRQGSRGIPLALRQDGPISPPPPPPPPLVPPPLAPPPPPLVPPPPSAEAHASGRESLLSSITQFNLATLKPTQPATGRDPSPVKEPDLVDSIGKVLMNVLGNRRKHLSDSDDEY